MPLPLVGLLGRARSGKDTFASFLIEEHGFTRRAFADPLKAAALALDPIVRVEPDEYGPLVEAGLRASSRFWEPQYIRLDVIVEAVGWEAAKEVREVRATLQRLGAAMRDKVDVDVWAKAPVERANLRVRLFFEPHVFTDVRFPNEAEAIRAAGGTLVRIVRPGAGLTGAAALHPSETALDGFVTDVTIDNSGTLAALREEAETFAENLL